MIKRFPFYRQTEGADCGPACIKIISEFYGKHTPFSKIKNNCPTDRNGTTLKGLSIAADSMGYRTNGVKVSYEGNDEESGLLDIPLPCIAYWDMRHYVVVYKANKSHVWVSDPAIGRKKYSRKEFEKYWVMDQDRGVLLMLEPTTEFYQTEDAEPEKRNYKKIIAYTRQFRGLFAQVFLGLLLTSVFSLILPFLTQMVVDEGIIKNNIDIIYLLLVSQVIIFVSSTLISFIQAWIFMHIGVRINVALVHDFLIKLMKLPVHYLQNRVIGDILQRIDDHQRINGFITNSLVSFIFSLLNIIVFSAVLLIYSTKLFWVYWLASAIYILWIMAFLKARKELDIKTFRMSAANRSKLIEIINGIQEIRIQGSQSKRRWQWVNLQGKIFKLRLKYLVLSQFQSAGAASINQLKNIYISFIAATAVINGDISLGMMLAVQYIIGFLNSPIESIIGFIQTAQDAKLGWDRISEVHEQPNEEIESEHKENHIPPKGSLYFNNVTFSYAIDQSPALQHVDFEIMRNKTTAIVGKSGSGKTTILKLLLGLYQPTQGEVTISGVNLSNIRLDAWRANCGAVMQDGFIFPDTIAHNICESDDEVDVEKMYKAADVAMINDFVDNMSNGFNTAIGEHGSSLSKGQAQRLLIARAVYKNPEFIFFDEATNSLDATNEKHIMDNLTKFYDGKTVVIIAHRLSTIKNADQILVVDQGKIVEQGQHRELLEKKKYYYELVSNQLEINL